MLECRQGGERKLANPPGPHLLDARPRYEAGIGVEIRPGAARRGRPGRHSRPRTPVFDLDPSSDEEASDQLDGDEPVRPDPSFFPGSVGITP
jgi:hypothetical protein